MSLMRYSMMIVFVMSTLFLAAGAGCRKQADSPQNGPAAQTKQVTVEVTGMT